MVTDREVQQLSCKMVDVKDTRLSSSTQTQWEKLTDDDLTQINNRRDELNCRLPRHYGYGKDQVEREIDTWMSRADM